MGLMAKSIHFICSPLLFITSLSAALGCCFFYKKKRGKERKHVGKDSEPKFMKGVCAARQMWKALDTLLCSGTDMQMFNQYLEKKRLIP